MLTRWAEWTGDMGREGYVRFWLVGRDGQDRSVWDALAAFCPIQVFSRRTGWRSYFQPTVLALPRVEGFLASRWPILRITALVTYIVFSFFIFGIE